MNGKSKYAQHLLLTLALLLYGARAVRAGEPTEAIRTAINQGVDILANAKLDNKKQRAEVINRLREIVYPLFDFNEMAKRSLGANWSRINAQQQKEFAEAFTQLLEKTYADQIDRYDGQTVAYVGETVDKEYAEVNTKVKDKKGQAYSVDYKLRLVDGKWRIYDVVAENISVVNNYRSQFNRVIANSSFEELLNRIKNKEAS
ncbi:MAG TPA: ABC transporter substrate-binding protein [Methylomirabilota bacterium]|nr:ABC transporter substrate-binding protein [Methylomirabilota bacterium]